MAEIAFMASIVTVRDVAGEHHASEWVPIPCRRDARMALSTKNANLAGWVSFDGGRSIAPKIGACEIAGFLPRWHFR